MVVDLAIYRMTRRVRQWVPTAYDEAACEHVAKIKAMFAEMAVFHEVKTTMEGVKPGDTE